jgi:uncharacterized membrane protein YcfT
VTCPGPYLASPTAAREAWADVAKGACIVLVVFWHALTKHYLLVDWRLTVPVAGLWGTLGELFLPLRMPLFFTVSGVFAAAAAARPWRVAAARVWAPYRVYLLWLMIHTMVFTLTPGFPTLQAATVPEIAAQATVTPTNLWYLWALALYFVVGKITRRVPTHLVLTGAFLVSAAASAGWLDSPGDRAQILQNLAFYLAGTRLHASVRRLAAHRGRRLLLGAVAAFVAATLAATAFDASAWPGVSPAVSILGVIAGVTVAAALAAQSRVRRVLGGLGRRTLPVYVLHMPVIALLDLVLRDSIAGVSDTCRLALAAMGPAVLTALVLGLCLGTHRLLLIARMGWLFAPQRPAPRQSRSAEPAPTDHRRPRPLPPSARQARTDHDPHRPRRSWPRTVSRRGALEAQRHERQHR